jgi:RNA polymerase sigma-70 factor (ECF subfamily)
MADDSSEQAQWVREALDRYERPLVRYALRFTGDLESARDVVQDTFYKLCRRYPDRLNGRLAPWLYTVCRNRALDVRKKEGRMQTLEQHAAEAQADAAPGPGDRAALREEHALVLEAIAALPENQQEAFRLKFEHGLTYRDISKVMNMPLSTVSYTIARALTEVRARLRSTLDTKQAKERA